MEVLDHKCPACRAKLPFNPVTQKWDCEYCGNSYTLEQLEEFESKEREKNKNKTENKKIDNDIHADVYECPNCGAKVITDENTTATFCVYCGSTSIIKNKLEGEFKPVSIIPFKKTKEDAIEAFKEFKKGKIFTPKDFSEEKNIEKITGVYIPFWTYDCNVNGKIEVEAKDITTWSSGDYDYTKTDVYDVIRAGYMSYEKVPVDGSTKFDDDTMDSIEPFNYNELKQFNMSYLSGFLSEKYDVDKDEALVRAHDRILKSSIAELESTIKFYDSKYVKNSNIKIDTKKAEYILLPVWMLNIKYNDKMHLFAMNGQTGKMVGNIPIDKKKRFLYWLLVFGGVNVGFGMFALIYKLITWLSGKM